MLPRQKPQYSTSPNKLQDQDTGACHGVLLLTLQEGSSSLNPSPSQSLVRRSCTLLFSSSSLSPAPLVVSVLICYSKARSNNLFAFQLPAVFKNRLLFIFSFFLMILTEELHCLVFFPSLSSDVTEKMSVKNVWFVWVVFFFFVAENNRNYIAASIA